MKQTNIEETKHKGNLFRLANFVGILAVILIAIATTSCSKDNNDEPSNSGSLIGTWTYEETLTEDEDEGFGSVTMTLKFNKDNTGTIVEDWYYQTRATEHQRYSMDFSWSTTADSNGNDILRVSYVSGDQGEMELFPGESVVLWTRQYVLTGNILNIYGGEGVWVFNRK